MKEKVLFQQLLQFLTNECMRKADEKNRLIQDKIQLEVEMDLEEDSLFDQRGAESIKRMFSPLEDSFFDSIHKESPKKAQMNEKLKKLEILINNSSLAMDKMKEYINFVQLLEKLWDNNQLVKEIADKKEESFVEFTDDSNVSSDAKEMIASAIHFLEYEYPDIIFLFMPDEEDFITSAEENFNLIRILTYTISSTIESAEVDMVLVDLERREDDMIISVKISNRKRLVGHYAYKTALAII